MNTLERAAYLEEVIGDFEGLASDFEQSANDAKEEQAKLRKVIEEKR